MIERAALSLLGPEPVAAYIYDLAALKQHASWVQAQLPPGVEMYYAIKANSELPILETLAEVVDGFEVASQGEMELLARHFPKVPLICAGPGKTDRELELAADHLVHVESLYELERLAALARPAKLLLRLNPKLDHGQDSPMLMAGQPSPFGLTPEHLDQAFLILGQNPQLHCLGFHLHTRSLQLSLEQHQILLCQYFLLAEEWSQRYGLELQLLNLGGGIGVNYREPEAQFDFAGLCSALPKKPYRLRFECGRFLSAFCGYYVCQVLDLKESHGQYFAVCRGGTHHFRLPAAQQHSHPFQVIAGARQKGPRLSQVRLNVVGQLCTPKDRLASQVLVQEVAVGDLLLFPLAGAYAWNISHHDFLRHPHPHKLFLPARA